MINTYAVILTCFNRKDTTLRCLKQLYQQKTSGNMDVFLCDDASTDGTSEAVQKQFPKVHIVRGNGNLFWNRECWQHGKKLVRQSNMMPISG